MRLRLRPAGRCIIGALAVCALVPSWVSANTGAVLHRPTGHVYVMSGTDTVRDLIKQARAACQQKEGIAGNVKKENECSPLQNLPPGACEATYGKGHQSVTVGGYKWEKVSGYTGFIDCGRTQAESDQIFKKHCAKCTIWQHYTDTYNTQ